MLETCNKVAVAALLRRGQLGADLPVDRGAQGVDATPARYGDLVDRISFNAPYRADPARWAVVLEGFKVGAR